MSEQPGVAARTLRPVVAEAERQGVGAAELLAQVGLDAAVLEDPDARVPHALAVQTWLAAESLTADPFFGLNVATHADLSAYDVQVYAFFSSPDLRRGVERAIRHHRLSHDAATLSMHEDEDEVTLVHTLPAGPVLPPCIAMWIAATWLRWVREGTGRRVVPRAVRFPFPEPSARQVRAELVDTFDAPIHYGAPHVAITLDRGHLALPMRAADPGLLAVLDRHARERLAALPRSDDDFVNRVRTTLVEELADGDPGAAHVAERLGMSVSTLGRRLKEQGTSHKEVLGEVRHQMAVEYLADPRVGVTELAFLLGFSEASAFTRAFKRWTGMSPREYRSRL